MSTETGQLQVQSHIDKSMRALACVELVRVLYGREELRSLLAEFGQMHTEDAAAFEALQAANGEPCELRQGDGFESLREPRIGESPSAVVLALEARRATTKRVSTFEVAHPLVVELFRAKKPTVVTGATP